MDSASRDERGSTKHQQQFPDFRGCIWVFGGWKKNARAALDTVEKYSRERNTWIKMPGMSQKRCWAAAAVCIEKIFVSGGYNGQNLKSVECFDPTSGGRTSMGDMPGIRYGHSMISNGSKLCFLGGGDEKNRRIRTSEENAIWEELQPMNASRLPLPDVRFGLPGRRPKTYS